MIWRLLLVCLVSWATPAWAVDTIIVLTTGTSWTVPADFDPVNNTIEAWGGGSAGITGTTGTSTQGRQGGSGGGGGAYAKITAFNPGAGPIAYAIGQGAVANGTGAGGVTTWNTLTTINRVAGEQSGVAVTSYTETASYTPVADSLVIAYVGSRRTTNPPSVPSISGHGLTWTLILSSSTAVSGSANFRLHVFRGTAASPTAAAIVVDYGAESQVRIVLEVDEFRGHDATTPIQQSKAAAASAAASLTIPFDAACQPTAFVLSGTMTDTAAGTGVDPEAGFAELCDTTAGASQARMEVIIRANGADSTPQHVSSGTREWAGVAIEIRSATPALIAVGGGAHSGQTGGAGGLGSACTPTTDAQNGGAGGAGAARTVATGGGGGGGGGGAGPSGAGAVGIDGTASATVPVGGHGGAGGTTGGGTEGTASGGTGGNTTYKTDTSSAEVGGGGGGGGGGDGGISLPGSPGGASGKWGAGGAGGGGGGSTTQVGGAGSAGRNGVIIITYTPVAPTAGMFFRRRAQ